jgi:hypothetical protein
VKGIGCPLAIKTSKTIDNHTQPVSILDEIGFWDRLMGSGLPS